MMFRRWLPLIALVCLVITPNLAQTPISTPSPATSGCDLPVITPILNAINEARVRTNTRTPVIYNHDLCNIAYEQGLVIANGTYPDQNTLRRKDPSAPNGSTGLQDWIKKVGFRGYPAETYNVDIRTFSTQVYTENNVITYLMPQSVYSEFLLDPKWREIGVTRVVTNSNNTGVSSYIYVFIMGSQPNVLPLVGYQQGENEHIPVSDFMSARVDFWVSDELFYTGPDKDVSSKLSFIVFGEDETALNQLTCPPQFDQADWKPYALKLSYDVKTGIGPRIVYMRVCDTSNRDFTFSTRVNIITDSVPTAAFSFSRTDELSGTVNFINESTGDIVSYAWDFNNDGEPDSFEANPTANYTSAGTYLVRLTVTGRSGASASYEHRIIVQSPPTAVPPLAVVVANPSRGQIPLTVNFDASQSTGDITGYLWDANGDGLSEGSTPQLQYRFEQAGTYRVRLIVNGPGGSSEDNVDIIVDAPPASPTIPTSTYTPLPPIVISPTASPTATVTPMPSATLSIVTPLPTITPQSILTPISEDGLVIPLQVIWTDNYFVLTNSSSETLDHMALMRFVFTGANGTSYESTLWDSTEHPLEELHPNRCLVGFISGESRPWLDEIRESGARCDEIKQSATGSPFWRETPFEVTFNENLLTTCSSSPCEMMLNFPLVPKTGWLTLSWDYHYLVIRNNSGIRITESQLTGLDFQHPAGEFDGSVWNAVPGLDANECLYVARIDMVLEEQLDFLHLDENCVKLDGYSSSIHPFWAANNQSFSVKLQEIPLTTCRGNAVRGVCSIPQP